MSFSLIPIATLLSLLLFTACDNGGKYVVGDDYVCYQYWTFSFGTRHDTLPGADAATFKSVTDWLGHDSACAFFQDKPIDGVDVSTLRAERYPLSRDKNDYFYQDRAMRVAAPVTFKVLRWSGEDFWATDGRFAYYDTIRVEGVDLASFKVRGAFTATDKNHVYRFGELLPLADPGTYQENWKDLYSRDKSHIWYCGRLLEDVDYETFTVDKEGNAHDKNGPFSGEMRVGDEPTE